MRLAKPAKDGKSQRAHLMFAAKMGSPSAISALQGPEIPEPLEYLYNWFLELERTRTYNGMSGLPEPLTYERIEAWARMTARNPDLLEVEALLLLDLAVRNPDAKPEE